MIDTSTGLHQRFQQCGPWEYFPGGEFQHPLHGFWVESCYGAQPILRLGDYTILSCHGVQQGDPLGPLAFALALHPIIDKIQDQGPGLLIDAWYFDDGTLCGLAKDLHAALEITEGDGPAHGLHLHRANSLLYIPEDASPIPNPLPADIPTSRGGLHLLGSLSLPSLGVIRPQAAEDGAGGTTRPPRLPKWRPPSYALVSPSQCLPHHILKAKSIRHLFQRLVTSPWRSNATLWIHRLPKRPSEVDGIV